MATEPVRTGSHSPAELELLADLYLQSDQYLPALETIDRLLSLPAARALSHVRRAALESKAIDCRLARGDCQAALAQCREWLRDEEAIDSLVLRARLHVQMAKALQELGHIEECARSANRALELAEACGDLPACAQAFTVLGTTALRTGDLELARGHSEQAIAIYRRLGDDYRAARVRANLGLVHKNLCEWDAAAADFAHAIEVYERDGHYADTADPLMNLGIVLQKTGAWEQAAERYRACERVLVSVGEEGNKLARVGVGLGNVARLQRRFAESESHLLAALERARRIGARREETLALEFLGELDFDRGRHEAAIARYHEALAIAERTSPDGDLVVEIERRRAEALCALGRLDDAEAACARSQRLARCIDDRLENAIGHRVAGEIALARGARADAIASWETAATLLAAYRERHELARTSLLLGTHATDPRAARLPLFRACALFAELGCAALLEAAEAELRRVMGPEIAPLPARTESVLGRRHRAPSLVACSSAMRQVELLARRAAATELSVLVTGATGTGKELVARTIHTLSPRAAKPFLAVNCGALRADLALSQLFGHRKGAFTGAHAEGIGLVEAAHGGTLFLDEAGELPHDVQVTLLRFIESGEYMRLGETQVRRADVRIIAATNRPLRGADGERLFRRDLLYRLNEIEIRLPTLHERAEDIVPLARHFLSFYGGLEGPRLTGTAEAVLTTYAWPGNVRELENVMKRIAALHGGDAPIGAADLLPFLADDAAAARGTGDRAASERAAIETAWGQAHGNKSRLAELLGVSRKTLYARLKRLHIEL